MKDGIIRSVKTLFQFIKRKNHPLMIIDTSFDFTADTPGYWDHFWENNNGLGGGSNDPDRFSPTLRKYHQIIWSRELPCGSIMKLSEGDGSNYLTWNGFRFGSDSIIVSFRHKKNMDLMNELKVELDDFRHYFEEYIHYSYTHRRDDDFS